MNLRAPSVWLRLLFEMGSSLLLFTAAVIGWKRWDAFSRTVLIGAAAAFICPFAFVYEATPANMLRFFGNAFLITNLFGAIALVPPLLKRLAGRAVLAATVLAGGIMAFMLYVVASNVPFGSWYAPSGIFSPSPALWPVVLKQSYLPRGSVVWASVERAPDQFPPPASAQVPVVFGAYLKNCTAYSLHDVSGDCDAFFSRPSEDGLRRLHVTHLALTADWERAHRGDPWFALLESQAHYTVPSWASFAPHWWREDEQEWTLYRVRTPL